MAKVITWILALSVMLPFMFGLSLLGVMWQSWWLYPAWAWHVVPLGAPQMIKDDACPKCNGQLERDEVDIGVGVQQGPPHCIDCGWTPPKIRMGQCRSCGAVYDRLDGCPNGCNDESYG